jgi:membrane-bound serine protease (ClpP class)
MNLFERRRRLKGPVLLSALCLILVSLLLAGLGAQAASDGGGILVLTIRGPITPSVADYVELGFDRARETEATMVLIEMDTPGGLDKAMRSINRQILNSPVPVAVFVSPSGARAASAGTFITLAADVAAMAPGTTIGAAHPVSLVGKQDETMNEKVVNDSAAYIRSLAERSGRNADWAEEAVRESVSLTEREALEEGVIDLVASDIDDLLRSIEGREVKGRDGPVTLKTEGERLIPFPMDFRRRFLDTLGDPNIAYLLLMLGMLGIFFELSNPGAIYPGVIGAISIILALYSLQTLPVNYAGLLLMVVAIALFIAETQVTSFGLLSLAGVVALFIGSIMLFRSPEPWLRTSLKVVIPTVAFTAFFFIVILQRVISTYRRRPTTGLEGIIGEVGEAMEDLAPSGKIFVRGEIWQAVGEGEVRKKNRVRVTAARGLRLTVKKEQEEGG